MKVHHPNTKSRLKLIIFGSALFALFLIYFLFESFPPSFLSQDLMYVANPIFSVKNKVLGAFSGVFSVFLSKRGLQNDINSLKEKIMELETRNQEVDMLRKENDELKSALLRTDGKQMILASIISRPGYGIYNSLLIDAGSKSGVQTGMRVTAFGTVLLGYASDVSENSTRVKLVSFPDLETNVYMNGTTSAVAKGMGGENLEITLPNAIEVAEGGAITTLDTDFLLLGRADRIIKSPNDPFQKIIFRIPVNIQELRHVYLIK